MSTADLETDGVALLLAAEAGVDSGITSLRSALITLAGRAAGDLLEEVRASADVIRILEDLRLELRSRRARIDALLAG